MGVQTRSGRPMLRRVVDAVTRPIIGRDAPVPWWLTLLYLVAAAAPFTFAWIIEGTPDWWFAVLALLGVLFWLFVLACVEGRWEGTRSAVALGLALSAGALLAAFAILPRIETLLQALYQEGDASFGMSQGPFVYDGLTGGPDAAREAVGVWEGFASLTPEQTPGTIIAMWWLLVDSVMLVPAYGLLLLEWLLHARGPLRSYLSGAEVAAAVRWIRRVAYALVTFDLLENTVSGLTITAATKGWGASTSASWSLWFFSGAKWVLVLLVVVPGALLLLPNRRELRSDRPLGHGLLMSRFQLLGLAVLLGFGWQFSDQLEDVVIDASWWRLTFMVLAAVALGLLMSATARGLIEVDRVRSGGELTRRQLVSLELGGLLVTIVVLGLWWSGVAWAPRGLVIVAGLIAVSGFISWRIRRSAAGAELALAADRSHRPEPSRRVPGLISGVPVLLVGYWLVQATARLTVFEDDPVVRELSGKLAVGIALLLGGCLVVLQQARWADDRWARAEQRAQQAGAAAEKDEVDASTSAGAEAAEETRQWEWWGDRRVRRLGQTVLGYLLALGVGVYVWADPVDHAPAVGAIIVLFVSLALLTGLGSGLLLGADWLSDRLSPEGRNLPPEIFRIAHLRRIPVVSLLAGWLLVNQLLLGSGEHFDVVTVAADGPEGVPRSGESLPSAFAAWVDADDALVCGAPSSADGEVGAVPLVMVSSEGGGIRAAYWAASVLDQVFSGGGVELPEGCQAVASWSRVFALSGVSGGSVGFAAYLQQLADVPTTAPSDWETTRLAGDNDFLSAPLAWFMGPELVGWHMLRIGMPSRIVFQERSLAAAWDGDPDGRPDGTLSLYAASAEREIGPRVMLNAATVADGCILNVGPLAVSIPAAQGGCLDLGSPPSDLAGGADSVSYVCQSEDLGIFTAAMVSARFPVLSPTGRLQCGSGPTVWALDGGAVDAGGALTPLLIWPNLLQEVTAWNEATTGSCIVPVHIHIDNGGERLRQPNEPFSAGQIGALLTAKGAGDRSRSERARLALADLFAASYEFNRDGAAFQVQLDGADLQRYVRIFPRSAPAAEAPLGWYLSSLATDLIDSQLEALVDDAAEGHGPLAEISRWFGGELRCVPVD